MVLVIEYCGGYLCSPIQDSRIPQFAFSCEASMLFVQVVEKGATCHVCGGEEVDNLKFSGKTACSAVKIQNTKHDTDENVAKPQPTNHRGRIFYK